MNLINLDFSNVKTGSTAYDSSQLLKLIEKENLLCFFKGVNVNGMGCRIVHDDIDESYTIQFIEKLDLVSKSYTFINARIDEGVYKTYFEIVEL